MPSFDSGCYHLTALLPLLAGDGAADPRAWRWQPRLCSPAHSLRELLASFRSVDVPETAVEAERQAGPARAIPFSCDRRTHFARLVVIEDLAYNGRPNGDTLLDLLRGRLPAPGPRRRRGDGPDQLPCAYLLLLLDFDAADGERGSVEAYLNDLWPPMEQEWTLILRHCWGFDPDPRLRQQSFVDLILRHEIESTFTFSAYGAAAQRARLWQPASGRFLPSPSPDRRRLLALLLLWLLALALIVLVPLLLQLLALLSALAAPLLPLPSLMRAAIPAPSPERWLLVVGLGALLLPPLWQLLLRRANRPWPAQPGTDLRSVLKALYLQGRLLALAEERQRCAASEDPGVRRLFREFLRETQPHDRDRPSLRPGRIQPPGREERP